jgi:hypothetical protein
MATNDNEFEDDDFDVNDDEDYDMVDGPSVPANQSTGHEQSTNEVMECLAKLESAIHNGNVAVATEMASVLAKKRAAVSVKTDETSCKSLEDYLRYIYEYIYSRNECSTLKLELIAYIE